MPKVMFDFTEPDATGAWATIDDRVMGGTSRSTMRSDPAGYAVFQGTVSLERHGGFASVRSSPADRGLSAATAVVLELRGDPRQFKLSLLTDDGFDSISHQAAFSPDGGPWQVVRIPLADFRASFRGREVHGAPPIDPSRIRQVGLLIAGRQEGAFALQVRRITLE